MPLPIQNTHQFDVDNDFVGDDNVGNLNDSNNMHFGATLHEFFPKENCDEVPPLFATSAYTADASAGEEPLDSELDLFVGDDALTHINDMTTAGSASTGTISTPTAFTSDADATAIVVGQQQQQYRPMVSMNDAEYDNTVTAKPPLASRPTFVDATVATAAVDNSMLPNVLDDEAWINNNITVDSITMNTTTTTTTGDTDVPAIVVGQQQEPIIMESMNDFTCENSAMATMAMMQPMNPLQWVHLLYWSVQLGLPLLPLPLGMPPPLQPVQQHITLPTTATTAPLVDKGKRKAPPASGGQQNKNKTKRPKLTQIVGLAELNPYIHDAKLKQKGTRSYYLPLFSPSNEDRPATKFEVRHNSEDDSNQGTITVECKGSDGRWVEKFKCQKAEENGHKKRKQNEDGTFTCIYECTFTTDDRRTLNAKLPWMRAVYTHHDGRRYVLFYFGYCNGGDRDERSDQYLAPIPLHPSQITQATLHLHLR